MTKTKFAKKLLRVTPRYWDYVLDCKRHLSFDKARVVAGLLGTSSDLWQNKEAKPEERKSAWVLFSTRFEQ